MLHVARVFAEALVVVAPHGGTLSNVLFSTSSAIHTRRFQPTTTRVLELLPANRPNLCYERLCRALGVPYMGMLVPDSTYQQPMRVDAAQLLLALDQLLSH